jgi:hypothetical protein
VGSLMSDPAQAGASASAPTKYSKASSAGYQCGRVGAPAVSMAPRNTLRAIILGGGELAAGAVLLLRNNWIPPDWRQAVALRVQVGI